jgi:outer membrane protein TolC
MKYLSDFCGFPRVSCFAACIFVLHGQTGTAQTPILTPSEAVQIALINHYDVRLAKSEARIAQLNNTKGNAGMLPTVNLIANEIFTLSTFQQKLSNGNEFRALGAPFNNVSAALQVSWPLFDGRRMQYAKKRLEQTEVLGQLSLNSWAQQTTAAVLQQYYGIIRSQLTEKATAEIIVLNEERLRIAEARLAAGFAAQTDALQARIDLNQRRADLLLQKAATTAAKRSLNNLLARDPATSFETEENLINTYQPDRPALLQQLQTANPALQMLQKSAEVSALTVEEVRRADRLRLNGIGQLTAARADNGSGFLLNNTQAGVVVGAGLVKPLYAGGNFKRQTAVAQVQAEQAHVRIEQQKLLLETTLDNQLALFQTQQQILTLEQENTEIARESLKVSTERFRLGQTTALEVQSAQNVLEQALTRLNLAKFNLKMAEIQMRLLTGSL